MRAESISESALLTINFWDSSLNVLGSYSSSQSLTGTTDWAQLTVEAPAPANTRYVRVEFRIYGPGTVWADDVALFEEGPGQTFTLTASADPSSLPVGQSSAITIQTSDARSGVEIALSTTLGTLSAAACTTDQSGTCSVTLGSTAAGGATVTVAAAGYSPGSLTVMFTEGSAACTYYVATTGDDANDGRTVLSAFRTIQKAADAVQPGEVMCVRQGSYAGFHIRGKNGGPGSWIVFKPYPGDEGRAIIDSYEPYRDTGIDSDTLLRGVELSGSSYVELNGFGITCSNPLYDSNDPADYTKGVGGEAIKWNDAYGSYGPVHHVRIVNNEIDHIGNNGLLGAGHHVEILGNRFDAIGLNRLGYGIYLGGDDHVIRGNVVRNAYGHGIHLYGGFDPPDRILVEGNVLSGNGRSDYARGWDWRDCKINGCPYGDGLIDWGGSSNVIRNNVAHANHMAGMTIHSQNDSVYNNTVHGNLGPNGESPGLWVTADKNVTLRNNLSYGNASANQSVGGGNTHDHNSWNLGIGEPLFVDPQAGDFHLQSTSPAIDAGTSLGAPPTDFEGTSRPQGAGYDLGAYEYSLAPAVATPAISPNGGSFAGSVIASLSTTTAGATIRYTTDGSEPTVSSTLYGAPFTLTSNATVKARAFKPGYADSAVASASFTVSASVITLPAFPGAEGYGAASKGGRGGQVIEVTNLDDSGPGSFREAVTATGPRIVVFRVGGTIELLSDVLLQGEGHAYLTVAGQTAPGGGILIKRYGIQIIDTHDVVIRHLRLRPGVWPLGHGAKEDIVIWGLNGTTYNVVLDHVSESWKTDDSMIWGNVRDVTIQWSIFAEGARELQDPALYCGGCGFLWGPVDKVNHVSFHHNLLMHNWYRNPLVGGGEHQVINNVVYNPGWSATIIMGYPQYPPYSLSADFIGNYYKQGPDTRPGVPEISFDNHDGSNVSLYVRDNFGWSYDPNDPHAVVAPGSYARRSAPIASPPARPVTIQGHAAAKDSVVARAGATLPVRDGVDTRLIDEFNTGTGTIGIGSTYPTIANGTPPADADHDAMPDEWEAGRGLDPHDPSDGPEDRDGDGYTNVEEYLNGLAGDAGPEPSLDRTAPAMP